MVSCLGFELCNTFHSYLAVFISCGFVSDVFFRNNIFIFLFTLKAFNTFEININIHSHSRLEIFLFRLLLAFDLVLLQILYLQIH